MTIVLTPSCMLTRPAEVKLPPVKRPDMPIPEIHEKHYLSYDNDSLGYKKWLPEKIDPELIIIGVHGISGHAGDYENFAKHLLKHHQKIALYAPETRGQGMDPKIHRRGDIQNPEHWYQDLYTFTQLVREKHPTAKLLWFGESMGSLIVTHAYKNQPKGFSPPDGVIISSPILDVQPKLPAWKYSLAKTTRFLLPKLRISLESLSSDDNKQVTKQDIHEQQAAINPWYIKRYTLRLLLDLADMADHMSEVSRKLHCPLLVVHGRKDIFTSKQAVDRFYQALPEALDKKLLHYPDSYHLLMYDHNKAKIFQDISEWISTRYTNE